MPSPEPAGSASGSRWSPSWWSGWAATWRSTTRPAAERGSVSASSLRPPWPRSRRSVVRRRLEHALPVLVLLGFATAAVLVNLLLADAQDRGVAALEEAVGSEEHTSELQSLMR